MRRVKVICGECKSDMYQTRRQDEDVMYNEYVCPSCKKKVIIKEVSSR